VSSLLAQEIPITNWSAPPFWSPPVKWEKGATARPFAAEGVGTVSLPFVAVPPCRIADTRGNGFAGQAGPPALLANVARTFHVTGLVPGVPTQCSISSAAQAVSFQFTVINMNSNGNLIAWPSGPAPNTSVLNWNANSLAIGSGTVVQISAPGAVNVQVNAPFGASADLVIDVNGYYPAGGFDGTYVNESQANSITSAMIVPGTIVDADISASAAIADTKLATIATAGKVADTALSANVTKLGQSIDANEITNITRSVSIPLTSFFDCQTTPHARLNFTDGADSIASLVSFAADGFGTLLTFDATPGSEDQDSEVCSQLSVPADYVLGGVFRVRAAKNTSSGATEVLNCAVSIDSGPLLAVGTVEITQTSPTSYLCMPIMPTQSAGNSLSFYLSITSSGTMNEAVNISSVAFEYLASQ
jgi:hypothetical protein